MKKAFTMAEVLITLGIIAVVAAMTLPALIQKYNIQVTEVRLKKFYSIFNQAILQSTLKNGPYEGWNYWNNDITQEDGTTINRQEANHKSFNLYIAPFLKVYSTKKLKYTAGAYAGDDYYMYYLSDGSAFRYSRHENREIFFYPRNPEKCLKMEEQGQSVYGTCVFAFTFYPLRNNEKWVHHYKKGLEPFLFQWSGTDDYLYNANVYGCKIQNSANGGGYYCTAIIQRNGWKVPNDYPRKIVY